ncbi:TonB family protein [Pontibacter sp. KCTC 32443]|uniref:energy transducer TonB n=1 Tax=Pontibacter TaxID=323449 RepID=UPI00164EACCD|nr:MULTISPECIES: energy transducer TonB [Pontibacter]MBC5775138.1 TonB family protein [Pontibacter sp. KCTC 32443]
MKLTFTISLAVALLLYFPERAFSQNNTDGAASKTVYEYVETMPSYNGGQDAMLKYLSSSIPYTNAQAQGLVVVSFVVDTDGSVNQVKVLKSLHPKLDSVCVQSVKNMSGHWTSGYQKGKPVAVRYTLPVKFTNNSSGSSTDKQDMPEFTGGRTAFENFMYRKAKYPKGAKKHGTIYVSFIINEDGSLSDYALQNSLEPILDEEALRLAKLTEGKWIPIEKDGKKVKIRYTMPVVF